MVAVRTTEADLAAAQSFRQYTSGNGYTAKGQRMRQVWGPVLGRRRALPGLVRFLAVNCAIGIVSGWTVLALLIFSGTSGLAALIWNSDSPILPLAMLAAGFAITFGSAAMGAAVMMIRNGDE